MEYQQQQINTKLQNHKKEEIVSYFSRNELNFYTTSEKRIVLQILLGKKMRNECVIWIFIYLFEKMLISAAYLDTYEVYGVFRTRSALQDICSNVLSRRPQFTPFKPFKFWDYLSNLTNQSDLYFTLYNDLAQNCADGNAEA